MKYYNIMKNSLLVAIGIAVASCFASCAPEGEPTYRVDGDTPQERYSVTLTPDSTGYAATTFAKGKKVKHIVMPPKSRPFIAHDLLARAISPFYIACGDTIYNILNADEVYTYSVTYDRKCVPDYEVLLRDFIANSGVKCDTSTEPAHMLRIVDTARYRAAIAPFLRSRGVNVRFDAEGHWMYYTPMPEGDTRHPMHLFEIISALRYYWGITVVPDPSLDLLELFNTGADFATPGLDEAQVCDMLMSKFGMGLDYADRNVTQIGIWVK